jgi:putative ABC transport system permease protein
MSRGGCPPASVEAWLGSCGWEVDPGTYATGRNEVKFFPLVWAGLWRRPIRTLLTLLSVTTAFFLFGVLQGVNAGMNSVFDLLDVSRLRVMSRVNMNASMPIAHMSKIRALPGVAAATQLTVVVGTYQKPTQPITVLGVDIDGLLDAYGEMKVPREQREAVKRMRIGALVGAKLAERYGWKIGDRVPVQSFNARTMSGSNLWEFEIAGIYDMQQHDWANNFWVNFEYVNEARAEEKDTMVQALVRVSDPKRSAQVAQQIDNLFAQTPNQTSTQNERDFLQGVLAQVGDIGFLVNAIVGAVLFALFFLTANTMMQSVRERIPELAVLKTLGFSDTRVQFMVLSEALLLNMVAALLGLLAARAIIPPVMNRASSDLAGISMPSVVFAWGAAIALILAVASGLPPAWRARRLRIVDALAGR